MRHLIKTYGKKVCIRLALFSNDTEFFILLLTRAPTSNSPKEIKDSRKYDITELPSLVRSCETVEMTITDTAFLKDVIEQ